MVAVLGLRGRGGYGALCLGCRPLGSFDDIDDLEDGIEVGGFRFGSSIVECRTRLEKPVFLLELARKSVG